MTQQIFTVVKNGNAFYSQSTFGFPSAFYESVPVQYSFDLGQEFLIYHGQGEASPTFGFSIEITTARLEDRQLIFPYEVKLLNPSGALVKFWNASSTNGTQSIFNFPVVPADAVEMTNYGWWRCQVFFSTPNLPGYIYFNSLSFIKNIQYQQTALTYRWLGHSFWNVLNVLTPQVGINGGQVYVTALQEMHNSVSSIPAVNITKSYDNLTGDFEMTALSIDACSGQDILTYIKAGQDAALIVYQQAAAIYQKSLSAVDESASSFAQAKYQAWVKKYQTAVNEVKANDLALRILPVFSDPTISFSEYDIGGYLQFESAPTLFIKLGQGPVDTVYGFAEIDYQIEDLNVVENALIYLFSRKNYDTIHNINGQIESGIFSNGPLILNYLFLALNKAAGQVAMVTSASAVNGEWVLTYYNQITHPDPATAYIPHIPVPIKPLPVDTGTLAPGPLSEAHPVAPVTPKAIGGILQPPVPFKFPAGFEVVQGTAIERLDRIETLVVVMMENRSFDHIFGDLANTYPKVPYTCFPVGFTNNKAGNFTGPVPVCPAASLFFPDVNITPVSPEHGFKHVMNQISDGNFDTTKMDPTNAANAANLQKLGLMQGFTSDIETRFNVQGANPQYPDRTPSFDSPQMVMSYYQKNQLPTYYSIAEQFKILDHWFAALPGETWPNRIATHTGKVIQLDNFSLKDPRLGYFTEQTIFDVLTQYGVDWVFMESNASILRIFNKYRIDDKNVIPLHRSTYNATVEFGINSDDLAGLDDVLSRPTLPRVMFIEPRFSDEPPLRKAYDDLAPTDISHGQEFIAKVYQKLSASSHWPQMTLLVTYDEHGGFFDHVPPPGTAKSNLNITVPPIYTNPDDPTDIGPSCTGVRVPAMLLSPYVSPATVAPVVVFDHTSIIKTILVNNRNKFPAGVFTSFSERVNQAHHLGEVLDLDTPRPAPSISIPTGTPSIVPSGVTSYFGVKNVSDTDYHECLRTLFMPK